MKNLLQSAALLAVVVSGPSLAQQPQVPAPDYYVDAIYAFIADDPRITVVHAPEDGEEFAPGYYSLLFEDPDGIRVEVNFVPGRGHFGAGGPGCNWQMAVNYFNCDALLLSGIQ